MRAFPNLRVLILLPNLQGGGAERLHVHLAHHWNSQGLKVIFALMSRRGDLLDLLPEGVDIVDLGADRIREVVLPFARYLRNTRPDVIVAAMWPLTSAAVLAWRIAGKPGRLYLSDHIRLSDSCVEELEISPYLVSAALRITYPLASGLIAVSQGVKKDMCKLGGLPESRVKVIYNPTAIGIAPHRESAQVRDALWGAGFVHHILSVGTLKKQKDQATLIKAFARLPANLNAKLTILGEGSLRFELAALIAQLGLQDSVEMPGFVVDPYPWFRSADLFVLSSRWEGFGNVIVEALECGVPVVSTDCPSGPAEILAGGRYGRLVPIQDPTALATAIAQSLAEPVDRNILMRRAKDFTVSVIADQYLAYMTAPQNSAVVAG